MEALVVVSLVVYFCLVMLAFGSLKEKIAFFLIILSFFFHLSIPPSWLLSLFSLSVFPLLF